MRLVPRFSHAPGSVWSKDGTASVQRKMLTFNEFRKRPKVRKARTDGKRNSGHVRRQEAQLHIDWAFKMFEQIRNLPSLDLNL